MNLQTLLEMSDSEIEKLIEAGVVDDEMGDVGAFQDPMQAAEIDPTDVYRKLAVLLAEVFRIRSAEDFQEVVVFGNNITGARQIRAEIMCDESFISSVTIEGTIHFNDSRTPEAKRKHLSSIALYLRFLIYGNDTHWGRKSDIEVQLPTFFYDRTTKTIVRPEDGVVYDRDDPI